MPTTMPARPQEYTNGKFDPVPHDHQISTVVLSIYARTNGTITARITEGSNFFKVLQIYSYDLVRERVDSEEIPGRHSPLFIWDEQEAGSSDGITPLQVSTGQFIQVEVAVKVSEHSIPPGNFGGSCLIEGSAFNHTISLTGTYLGVDENSPIGQKWRQLGGEAKLGEVRSNAHPLIGGGPDLIQEFANGVLYQVSGKGVYYLSSAIYAKWNSPSVAQALTAAGDTIQHTLGYPIEDTFITVEKGEALRFQGGAIVARVNSQVYVVYGAIYTHYIYSGNLSDPTHQSFMGLPTSDELPATNTDGRVSHFDFADIYWNFKTGAHEVHGAIRDCWIAVGGVGGTLGFPITDELAYADGMGRYNWFENGQIYWTPATGAHALYGPILDKWKSLSYERSYLGYPTSGITNWTNPTSHEQGSITSFQYGQLGWTGKDGIVEFPETKVFHQDIVTPSGTALGGWVEVSLSSNGSYSFKGHLHDSGFDPYSFRVIALIKSVDNSGARPVIYSAFAKAGHVDGTGSNLLGSPNRDFDWTETGDDIMRDAPQTAKHEWSFIRDNWPQVRTGTLSVNFDYQDVGLLGDLEDLAVKIFKFCIPVTGGTELVHTIVHLVTKELRSILPAPLEAIAGIPGLVVNDNNIWIYAGVGLAFLVGGPLVGVGAAILASKIKTRNLSAEEWNWANDQVFKGTLPTADQIVLTNLTGLSNRAMTMPGYLGKIFIHIGITEEAYNSPMTYSQGNYSTPGQVFIHELTHAWQIAHASWLPGFVCRAVGTQLGNDSHNSAYNYGQPGPEWSDFNPEQQASIVDQWFGGNGGPSYGPPLTNRSPMNPQDPYFGYILNNIWQVHS